MRGLERFGAVEDSAVRAKLLKTMVGAWGFEPQTPTVSSSARRWANSFKNNKH